MRQMDDNLIHRELKLTNFSPLCLIVRIATIQAIGHPVRK